MNSSNLESKSGPVYRTLVASLFEDVEILVMGVLASGIAILITAYETNSTTLYAMAGFQVVLGAARVICTRSFQHSSRYRELTDAASRWWEIRFSLGAASHSLLLGIWFFVVSLQGDPVALLISLGVTSANIIGVCCRSYPFNRLVILQIACFFGPIMLSLLMLGGYYVVLAVLMVPYMLSLRKIASDLRKQLLHNIFQRMDAEKLASEFDTALNSVPQGISMYNSDGILEVANKHISAVTGRSAKSLVGNSAVQMIDMLMHERGVSAEDCAVLLKWVADPEQDHITHVFEMGQHPKRSIKFKSNRLKSGGIIATYEDISSEVLAASRIDHITRFDRLTGLLNRGQFTALLDQNIFMSRQENGFSILLVNLNNFKHVNETLGHRIGDRLLCVATNRLKEACDEIGICARYGGDEFAIFIDGKDNEDVTLTLADTIVEALNKPYELEDQIAKVGCSVGIVFSKTRSSDAETLLRQADLALSFAKQSEFSDWKVYSEDMGRELQELRELEEVLLASIQNNELEAFFQPLVSIEDKSVTVCEALVRWNHPRFGYVPPYKFIPLAEKLGFVNEIGDWMLYQSCAACASWPNGTAVAVNLSPLQFMKGDLVKTIKRVLKETGLDPSRLELEVTESLMLDDVESTIEKLGELKKLGIKISLDDFGTGYSSLSYMNQLPLDKVKIDRSFVTGLQADSKSLTLLQAISMMSHQLGLKVVVEGVETVDELAILLGHVSVDQIQGYLFSKPVNKYDVIDLLTTDTKQHETLIAQLDLGIKSAA